MKGTRNSSFELLRIMLILMILVEHGNMWFIGAGYQSVAEHWGKCIVQSLCIGAVNGFVLISGWFGIKNGLSKIMPLIFMILFCTVPLLIVALLLKWISLPEILSINGSYKYLLGGNNYWFVIDYIGLLIITPFLNGGIIRISKREFSNILVVGYLLIAGYDFILRSAVLGSEGGYSVLWFGYLYILARYLRIYGFSIIDKYRWLILIASIASQTILFYYGLIGLRYTNPLILLEAVSLILIFSKWDFRNRMINYASTGALMAYLLHMQPLFMAEISNFLGQVYLAHGYWIYMVEVLLFSCVLYIVAIFVNKVQKLLYNKLSLCW